MIKKSLIISSLLISLLTFSTTAQAITCQSGYVAYNGKCIKKLACQNGGSQSGTKCVCKSGWTGNLCQTAAKCPYSDTKCASGYVATGKYCYTGNKKVVECKANPCTGYGYTKCPTGYAQSASCLSGKTKKIKCETCASGYIKYQGKCIKKLACKNGGSQSGAKCVCKTGWTGNLCQTAAKCPYSTTKCDTGYIATGKTCQTGNKKVVECKANPCTGYGYTKCPTGYAQSATCQSGKTKKLKCEKCANGYIKYQGKCIKKLACKNGGAQSGTKCVCKAGWTGNLCQTAAKCPYSDTKCATGYVATGKTCQTGNKKVVECKVNPCAGYAYTTCPTGHVQTATCQSGKNKKLKCEKCSSGYTMFSGKCYKNITCKNGGKQNANKCVCPNGWTGTYCENKNTCPYTTTSCANGYVATGETCKSGNATYKKCAANPCTGYVTSCQDGYHKTNDTCLSGRTTTYKCEINTCDGYDYTQCPTGYNVSAVCQAGDTLKYKCDVCASGYHKEDGVCIADIDCGHGEQRGDACQCDNGWHGERCNEADTCEGYDYIECPQGYGISADCKSGGTVMHKCGNCAEGYHKEGNICIKTLACNHGHQNEDKCICDTGWDGDNCLDCADGYHKHDGICVPNPVCVHGNLSNGSETCDCDNGWGGELCDTCANGYHDERGQCVKDLECVHGSLNNSACDCDEGWSGELCNSCADGYHDERGQCVKDLACVHGSLNGNICDCDEGWSGQLCDTCANGYHDERGQCVKDLECVHGSLNNSACDCDEGWSGQLCDTCANGYTEYNGECIEIIECNNGQQVGNACRCAEGWSGQLCDTCANGYHDLNGACVKDLNCNNGQQQGYSCICNNGWHGDYCDEADTCEGYVASCPQGYHPNGNICHSGNTPMYKCEKDGGNDEEPNVKVNNDTIQITDATEEELVGMSSDDDSWVINAYADEQNTSAFIEVVQNDSGDAYGIKVTADPENNEYPLDDDELSSIFNAAAESDVNATAELKVKNTEDGDGIVAGIYSDAKYISVFNATGGKETSKNTEASALIEIENTGDKTVYGIFSANEAGNAGTGDTGTSSGTINIFNNGDGDVYGIKSAKDIHNTEAKHQARATAKINITNTGDGHVYGLSGNGDIYNAYAGHERGESDEKDTATATAEINVTNTGNGDVYGIKNDAENGTIYNAYAYYNSEADGTVRVVNKGTGNAYGLWGNTVYNVFAGQDQEYSTTANGIIKVNNTGNGNAYGIYGTNVYNKKSGTSYNPQSLIEMVNVGSGLAVGIYADNGNIVNTGDIKIHNLGDGIAVGIYADGNTTVTNSGNITIDRKNYLFSNMNGGYNFYQANTPTGGKAIGIYGAAGSDITNTETGVIRINNAETGYGIWSEGGNVTNNGLILIDGEFSENAIRLNAGTLFQDGIMIIGADWSDNGESGEESSLIGTYNTVNNDVINLENNYLRPVIGMFSETQNYGIANALNNSAEINITNNGDGNLYGVMTNSGIGTNARTANGDTDYTGTSGKIIITSEGDGDIYGLTADSSAQNAATNDYQFYGNGAEVLSDKNTTGEIRISNIGNGNIYGLKGSSATNAENDWYNNSKSTVSGKLEISNEGTGSVYGLYSDTGNLANVSAYNKMQTEYLQNGSTSRYISTLETTGNITINNIGDGNVYGLYGSGSNLVNSGANSSADAILHIHNEGEGNVYGMYGSQIQNTYISLYIDDEEDFVSNNSTSLITVENIGSGKVYGMLSAGSGYNSIYNLRNETSGSVEANSDVGSMIQIISTDSSEVYGMKADYAYNAYGNGSAAISIINEGDGTVYGMQGQSIYNQYEGNGQADISISSTGGTNEAGNVYGMYGENITNAYGGNGRITIDTVNSANVYGIYATQNAQNVSSYNDDKITGSILMNTENVQNVYGIYSDNSASNGIIGYICDNGNCYEAEKNATGIINITNNSEQGNVYGMYAASSNNSNEINIDNSGNGNVYGMYATNSAYNSQFGNIAITNNGAGNVYGLYAATHSENRGSIKIDNLGNGNAYGMYGNSDNSGTINIINHATGNIYGISIGTLRGGNNDDAVIELVNRNDGLAVGLYAYNGDFSFNSTIKIHNLGNGTAVGIYADGNTEFENKGIIIIDRDSYADNNGEVYAPDTARGGKAIGIYGARNTDIENSGIIRISGAETAYGIFSEGGNVENSGTIEIDGQYTENAIRINGGTLFQNGTMYVGADWSDTGQQGNGNDEEDDENVIISNQNISRIEESDGDVIGLDIQEKASVANVYADNQDRNITIEVTQNGTGDAYGIRQLKILPVGEDDDFDMYNAVAANGQTATGTIRIVNTQDGQGRIAGIYSNADYVEYIGNASVDTDDHNNQSVGTANGLIEITNTGNKKVYGILSAAGAGNAEGDEQSIGNGIIRINNNGNGYVFGIKSVEEAFSADATENGTANSLIQINNTGDGNIYGIFNTGEVIFNAMAGHERGIGEEKDAATAKSLININNVGDGYVFGIMNSPDGYGNIFNADASYNSNAEGRVRISNNGSGKAYGLWSSNGEIQNASVDNNDGYSPIARGIVNIINHGNGNAAGILGQHVYNNSNGENQLSKVEIVNRGNGYAVGLYSQNGTIENSGDIIIHNLGNGTAIGIYSDGFAGIINSGNITIDRANYTDDMGTEDQSDDQTYQAAGNGGMAIGIYGATGHIVNQRNGVITINDHSDAYGIYTEGNNVENYGQIIINGNANSANKIVLNGGSLFQNGILSITNNYDDDEDDDEDFEIVYNNDKIYADGDSGADVVGMDLQDVIGLNAYAHEEDETGSIEVTQRGTGSVYGMRATVTNPIYGDDDIDNDHDRYDLINSATDSTYTSKGIIQVYNFSDGDGEVFGMYSQTRDIHTENATYGDDNATEDTFAEGLIEINSTGNKNVYGIFSGEEATNAEGDEIGTSSGTINITNIGNGNVYGIRAYDAAYNTDATENSAAEGIININNTGNGNVYGLFSVRSRLFNADSAHERDWAEEKDTATTRALININNTGDGDVYGMKGVFGNDENKKVINAQAYYNSTASGRIRISNNGTGNAFGMYGSAVYNTYIGGEYEGYSPSANGAVNIINKNDGTAVGMYGRIVENRTDDYQNSVVELANVGNGTAIGIYVNGNYALNTGDVKIHNLGNGTAVGIYADNADVSNLGKITIDRTPYVDDMGTMGEEDTEDDVTYSTADQTGGTAIGIYGTASSRIFNDEGAVITINGASNAYGIYSEGGEVYNDGQIIIDGNSDHENAIVLNGGSLFQDGILIVSNDGNEGQMNLTSSDAPVKPKKQAASLNLDDFGGTVVASETSQFIVEGNISGDLAINNSVVENGFNTVYTVDGMIKAVDTNGLNLISQSALFDATLKNNSDAVMTMKSFNDVIKNQSFAEFLKRNYAEANNEQLFGLLKNKETIASLNSAVNSLAAVDVFNRFNFEDLTMMRELNMDVNNTLFNNNEDYLVTSGNVAPFYFDNDSGSNGRYALYNHRIGKTSYGLSMAFANVNSSDHNDDNRRRDETFQMSVPFGYNTHGFKFITAPRFGYAYGTYTRDGYEGRTYDGKIEKRIFGITNEARYPLNFGKWNVSPSAEFNMLGYHLKGHEEAKEYALRIKSQNNYSIEAGFGLYANREFKPTKNSSLNLTAGIAAYHEFADPYAIELGMQNMSGSFNIRDERRKDNRAVIRTGFDYNYGNISVQGSWATYVDGTTHNNANLDLRYNF